MIRMPFETFRQSGNLALAVKRYVSAVAFNNITGIVLGKRFVDVEGNIDPQGVEFKEIVAQGMKLGASLKLSEHIPFLRCMFPLQEEEFEKHGMRMDNLTRTILQEHALQQKDKTSETEQHFVDALLTLKDEYNLNETTVIGLLWVSRFLRRAFSPVTLSPVPCSPTISAHHPYCAGSGYGFGFSVSTKKDTQNYDYGIFLQGYSEHASNAQYGQVQFLSFHKSGVLGSVASLKLQNDKDLIEMEGRCKIGGIKLIREAKLFKQISL